MKVENDLVYRLLFVMTRLSGEPFIFMFWLFGVLRLHCTRLLRRTVVPFI
jgi:hypothetical protein